MTEKRFINDVDNGKLFDTKRELSTIYYSDKVDFYELCEFLNKLNDENEQLKQAIAETEKMVQSTYDELTKLRCFKKNILQIKHSWDYLMEAIQYD